MLNLYTLAMRTNIDIDDELMKKALESGRFKTKKEAVHAGLKLIVMKGQQKEKDIVKEELIRKGSITQKLFGAAEPDSDQDYTSIIEKARNKKMGYE